MHTHGYKHTHLHVHISTQIHKTVANQTAILTFCPAEFSWQSGFTRSKLTLSSHTEQVGTHRLQPCHLVSKPPINQFFKP